jgi:iron complex transport system substrate-binding protein
MASIGDPRHPGGAISRRVVLGSVGALFFSAAVPGCRARARAGAGPVRRVISLSPSTTETMFAVGAGSLLVARSRYCDYPPEALRLPSVGGYVDPSFEAILALTPDLVTGARGPAGPGLTEKLEAKGIATYFPATESMHQIDEMVLGLSTRVGHAEDGARLVATMKRDRDAIAAAVDARARPRTLLLFGLAPIVAAGPGSFPDEMITLAGGTNVIGAGKTTTTYPTIDFEHVLALDPDVILDAAVMEHRSVAELGSTWSAVRAVRAGRVIPLSNEAVLRPGPRVAEGLRELAHALHPTAVP